MTTLLMTEPPADVIPSAALAGRFAPTRQAVLLHLADYEQKAPGGLALRVLRQIGKRTDLIGTRSIREQEHTKYLPVWTAAHGIHTAVITDAHRVRPWVIRTLLDPAPTLDTVTLISEPGHRDHTENVMTRYGLDVGTISWGDFLTVHPVLEQEPDAEPRYGMEHLPHVDFLLFRDRCQRHNNPERFHAIDDDYRTAFVAAKEVEPTEDAVITLLTARVREATTTAEILVAVRATQRALFARGHLMQAHPDRLLGTLTAIHPPKPTAQHWHSLRAYIRPERAAVIALYAIGLPTHSLRAVSIADLTDALTTGRISGHTIPALARPYLSAQLERRLAEGAQPAEPFLQLPGVRQHQEILTDARRCGSPRIVEGFSMRRPGRGPRLGGCSRRRWG